jgi:phage terminase large subunit-like protein
MDRRDRRRFPSSLVVLGGRGAGKTRAGAEWVNALVRGWPPYTPKLVMHGRLALIGETFADVREVMIDGPSGLRSLDYRAVRADRPRFEANRRRLVWDNGATAMMFSSEDPDSLRGPQFDAAWGDEAGKWKNAETVFDMLQFGLRLGENPRQLFTTTPRSTPLMQRLLADKATVVWRSRADDNAANLSPGFVAAVRGRYGETALGRQELDGELIVDRPDALWSRELIEGAYLADPPALRRIVVAVDPPASSRKSSDACGIVAAGLDDMGRAIVLADESFGAAKPLDWANRAVGLYHRLQADCLLVEVNQGGEMVSAVIGSVDRNVPVKAVRARHDKWTRAEPVALAYQQKRVLHAGRFPALEDELCDFGRNGLSGNRSPDRLDALVWAVGELLGAERAEPRVRSL